MIKVLKTIGTFVLCVIGACIIIVIIGWITDLGTRGQLKKEGEKSLTFLKQFQMEPQDNAWDYYNQVIEDMKKRKLDYVVSQYLTQEIELTPEVKTEITAYPDLIQLIRQGNAQPDCWIPIPYEEGAAAWIPEYVHLSGAAKVIGAQALAALENNDPDKALDRNLLGLSYAQHMVHGTPILINYMVSLVILGVQLNTIEYALMHDAYDADQLERLHKALTDYEEGFPSLLVSLQVEQATMSLTIANWPAGESMFQSIGVLESNILYGFGERLISWRYWFSMRNSILHAIRYTNNMLATAEQSMVGKKGVEQDIAVLQSLEQSRPEKYAKKNLFFGLYMPNLPSMFSRKLNSQARIRMVQCAVILRSHQKKYGNFPQKLDAFDQDITRDPFTNETWEYIINDKEITLQSPGFDQDYNTDDDIAIILQGK